MSRDKIILGENLSFSTDTDKTGINNNNVVVCAGSGSGKTMSIIEPRLINTFDSSLIVTLTKRRLVPKYKSLFEERGYEVQDLNFVNPKLSTVTYDPLKYVKSYSDINFLAQSIVLSDPRKRKESSSIDPYWDNAAISLLSAEIAYVMMSKEDRTFADVLKMHDNLNLREYGSSISTSYDSQFERMAEEDPGCFAVNCWNSFKSLPIKTASCVFGTLNTTIDNIFSPEMRKMISDKKKINFKSIAKKKTVLFITTSAVNPSLNCFVNMFYAQMFKQLFEFAESLPSGQLPIPVSVLCDDFATGSKVLNFPEYISILREKKISVTILLQSESQLESIYGTNDATTIINNCDTYVFMGGMDLVTASHISQRLNVPIEDVLYMPIGKEYVFRRGQKPVSTNRYNILKDKVYQRVTEKYNMLVSSGNESDRR